MPIARANWKGFLHLSLVSCPVALYPATSDERKISLNRINKATGNRLRQQNIDEVTKEVIPLEQAGKAFQVDKEHRVPIEDEELEAIELESKRSIQIEQFVPAEQIDQRYIVRPYYIVPDGEAGEEAYAVIRDAMKEENVVGVGKVMLSSREHMIAIQPLGNGIMGNLLRYPSEVRKEKDYFDEVPHVEIPEDMLDMAKTLIKKYEGKFDPSQFKDRYGDALHALIERKQKEGGINVRAAAAKAGASTNVVNLMDMLKASVGKGEVAKPSRRAAQPRAAASTKRPAAAKRSSARGRKAG
jgi:DNA end-binding protein Ku